MQDDPSCPCLRNITHTNTPTLMNGACLDTLIELNFSGIRSSFCYPLSYGTTCAKHDESLEPFCNGGRDGRPEFCDSPWCYVDPSKCKFSENTYARSLFFQNLFYSYDTCGGENTWEDFGTINALAGTTLRVGIPFLFYPDHYTLDMNGRIIAFDNDIFAGTGDFKGIYVEYLESIAAKAKFQVEYTPVSEGALVQNERDAYSACVFDVARGVLDMCAGNFWITTPRRKIAQFATSSFEDKYYLVVPSSHSDHGINAEMEKLFSPFTPSLWLTIVLVTHIVGISYTILGSNSRTSLKELCKNMITSIYVRSLEIMQGVEQSKESKQRNLPQRIVTVTWALFILIVVAAYTANLVAFLGREQKFLEINDIEECVAKDCKLCSLDFSVLRAQMKQIYPLAKLTSTYHTPIELMNALGDGTCQAVLVSEFDWELNQDYLANCNTSFTGNVVISFRDGSPVSSKISLSMSYWIGETINEFNDILTNYRPLQRCMILESNIEHIQAEQIGILSMAGPLMIVGIGICLGFLIKFGNFVKKKTRSL